MKQNIIRIISLLLAAVSGSILTMILLGVNVMRLGDQLPLLRKIAAVDNRVAASYNGEYDSVDAADGAAMGYVASLGDEYAYYYSADAYSGKLSEQEGDALGMGVTIAAHPDTGAITVVYVNKNSPAKKAGMQIGDIITAVDGEDMSGKTTQQLVEKTAGKAGTVRKLTVQRGKKTVQLSVELADFVADCVQYHSSGKTGIIKITSFNKVTPSQFDQALNALQKQAVTGLVFDLRDNGGGTVDECVEILDQLLPEGDLLRVKVRGGGIKTLERSDEKCVSLPMAVVINGATASAAELFTVNLKTLGGAVVVGEKSYGKGVVQTTFALGDGSAVKVTTQTVVDKNGESYHKVGISPDKEVKLSEKQQKYLYFTSEKDDIQLQTAIKALNAKQ